MNKIVGENARFGKDGPLALAKPQQSQPPSNDTANLDRRCSNPKRLKRATTMDSDWQSTCHSAGPTSGCSHWTFETAKSHRASHRANPTAIRWMVRPR
jgi:hypothetical protein